MASLLHEAHLTQILREDLSALRLLGFVLLGGLGGLVRALVMAALVRRRVFPNPFQQQQSRGIMYHRKPSARKIAEQELAATGMILTAPGVASKDRPSYTRLLPCPATPVGQRIEHILVNRKAAVVNVICDLLRLPEGYVIDLMNFGAVHYALRCPKPPQKLTTEQISLFKKASPKKWPALENLPLVEARRTARVTDPNQVAEPGSYIRVHVHPKRFPRCYEVDWTSRIIANEENFVVLNKPAGVSVGGSVDNIEEICATFAARALNLEKQLVTTHQLDNCTEGCLVLAKNNQFASRFHRLIKDGKIEKLYRVLAPAPVPVERIAHYMRYDRYPPRIICRDERLGWQLCVMQVLECNQVPWPSEDVLNEYRIQNCGWERSEYAYECKVKLLTGQTHQLRAQFAALDSPVLGDSLYMPAVVSRLKTPDIDPFITLNTQIERTREELKQAEAVWISRHGTEPPLGIGLQSCEISWTDEGETVKFCAGSPWWRTDEKEMEAQ